MNKLRAVSLFSNCGAGDVGFRRAGFSFEVLAELEDKRLAVALANHPGAHAVRGDIRETWPQVVAAYRARAGDEQPALLAACPPCQGMSSARGKRGLQDDADAGSRDSRNLLVLPIANVARALRPRIIVVENVPAFLSRKVRHPITEQPVSAARLLIELLASQYYVFPLEADLAHYGIPQTRKRAFITFIRKDTWICGFLKENLAPYPSPVTPGGKGREPSTVRKALEELERLGLPALDAREAASACDPQRELHAVPVWDSTRYEMVDAIPAFSGRTAWENQRCSACGIDAAVDPDAALCPICSAPLLRPVKAEPDGSIRLIRGFRTSSYKRMRPDAPAATITTGSGHIGSHTTIHPWQNRLLSTLECAALQTFPSDFHWGDALDRWGHTHVRAMIGEAVPPHFTYLHGLVLRGILTGSNRVPLIPLDDVRCRKARSKLNREFARAD